MGKKLGTSDPVFATHESFYEATSVDCDVCIVENVTEYSPDHARKGLGPGWEIQFEKLDPRILGLPAARARIYMICYRTSKVTWRRDVSLELVLGILASRVISDASMYFWLKLPPSTLSPAHDTWHC
jgi:hypothetical protein